MKNLLRATVLAASMLGVGLGAPVQAATAKKPEQQASKKADSKPASKSASKPAGKTAAKPASKNTQAAAPAKSVPKSAAAGNKSKTVHAAVETPRKPVRRVSAQQDIDPGRLALYSSSALVIDQSTGHAVIEKQPDVVVPIASISKLMTAMVVLDAKLNLQEVISIGDEDVDGLKGTRSRLPVGTTMTRETAMLLALMSSEN